MGESRSYPHGGCYAARARARRRGSIDDGREFENGIGRGGEGFYQGPKQEVGQIFSLRHARIVDYSRGENIGRNLARGNIGERVARRRDVGQFEDQSQSLSLSLSLFFSEPEHNG